MEEAIQGSITEFENIIGKNKKDQSIDKQENDDGYITRKAAEELAEFFFANREHTKSPEDRKSERPEDDSINLVMY